MKVLKLLVWSLVLSIAQTSAQNPGPPRDWTPWAPVQGEWAELYVLTNFVGGNRTPEQLAKKDIKSLKVECLIIGRLLGALPPELSGVKTVKVLYTEYGKFRGMDDFAEDSIVVPYANREQYFRTVTIIRPASQFDVDEASKPLTAVESTTQLPGVFVALGVGPTKHQLSGRRYRAACEWRRKGSTIELRVKDYRPSPEKGHSNP